MKKRNMKSFLIYIIGISGSGKTTISVELEKKLRERGIRRLQFIDGDVIREELNGIFGYTFEERIKNNRVVCVVASYLIRNGINIILAQVAPYEKIREQVRSFFQDSYVEVYVKCSPEECAKRDVKGHYTKAKCGKLENLNGFNEGYEIPSKSDIVVDTEIMSVDECVNTIVAYLEEKYGV